MGAAIQGALLAAESGGASWVDAGAVPPVQISDVSGHSIGVVTVDESGKPYNSVVLPENNPYGTRQEDTFCTVADGQQSILLRVTEGEGRELEGIGKAISFQRTRRRDNHLMTRPGEHLVTFRAAFTRPRLADGWAGPGLGRTR